MKQHIKTVKEFADFFTLEYPRDCEAMNEVVKAAERYEFLRTLSPVEFTQLWQNNIHCRGRFDDLVDEMMKARK